MEEVPLLKDLSTRYAKDVVIVGVSTDVSVDRVDRTIKEKGMTWPILADGKGFDGPITKSYHVQGTPDIYVLDREGKIAAYLESAKRVESTLRDLLAPKSH